VASASGQEKDIIYPPLWRRLLSLESSFTHKGSTLRGNSRVALLYWSCHIAIRHLAIKTGSLAAMRSSGTAISQWLYLLTAPEWLFPPTERRATVWKWRPSWGSYPYRRTRPIKACRNAPQGIQQCNQGPLYVISVPFTKYPWVFVTQAKHTRQVETTIPMSLRAVTMKSY